MPLIKGYKNILTKHVFDGLMRPFNPSTADTSWETTAPTNKWGALHYGKQSETSWLEYITNAMNKDSFPLQTIPNPAYIFFQDASSEVFSGGPYTIKDGTGISGGVIVRYQGSVDLSGVSVNDYWYSESDEPALVLSLNTSEKWVEVFGLSAKSANEKGVGVGTGNIKTGGILGDMVSKFITLNPPSSKLLKYNVSGSTSVFRSGEEVEEIETGKKGTLMGTDQPEYIWFKTSPVLKPVFPIPPWPPPPAPPGPPVYEVEFGTPQTPGSYVAIKLVNGLEENQVSVTFSPLTLGNKMYETSLMLGGYDFDIPSGIRQPIIPEKATFVELTDMDSEFTVGNTIKGLESGTTATLVNRDNSDDYDGHPIQESKEVRDAMLKMIGSANMCNCIVGSATLPLPVIVI